MASFPEGNSSRAHRFAGAKGHDCDQFNVMWRRRRDPLPEAVSLGSGSPLMSSNTRKYPGTEPIIRRSRVHVPYALRRDCGSDAGGGGARIRAALANPMPAFRLRGECPQIFCAEPRWLRGGLALQCGDVDLPGRNREVGRAGDARPWTTLRRGLDAWGPGAR